MLPQLFAFSHVHLSAKKDTDDFFLQGGLSGFSVLTTGNKALIGGETIAGITGRRLPLQISGQGLVQSLCLHLLLITSCKNLITGKLNHSNLKLRSPMSLFAIISQSSIMEQKMLSCHEFGNELLKKGLQTLRYPVADPL